MRSEFLLISDFPKDIINTLGERHSQRISTFVTDVINSSWDCTGEKVDSGIPWIRMSDKLKHIITELRNFMFEKFYHPISSSVEGKRSAEIVEILFSYYFENPDLIPKWLKNVSKNNERAAADMVCGMTDNYALQIAEQLRPGISNNVFQGRI